MPISLPASVDFPEHELTLRVDHTGTAFGTTPTWADWSSKLLTAGDGEPITITRLRTDENAEVTPSTCSFILDNTTGDVTPGNAAAPAGWDVGAEVNVRMLVLGTTYDRFDGYVDSIEPAYPGSNWSMVRVSCTDITARPALAAPLRSMLEQEMLEDNPSYLYPLSEASGSTSAGNVAKTTQPAAVRQDGKYGAGPLEFGTDMPGFAEPSSGVTFSTVAPALWPSTMSVLSITQNDNPSALVPSLGAHTQELWMVGPVGSLGSQTSYLLDQVGEVQLPVVAMLALSSGLVWYAMTDKAGVIGVSATATTTVYDGKLHHIVGTLNADRRTVKLYIDGVLVDTSVASAAMDFTGLRFNHVGGRLTPSVGGGQFPGTIAKVAMYPTELSAARILAHYQAGVGTIVESSDARYARIAGYRNLTTTGLPAGLATMGQQNTAGKGVTESLALVARTEGSVSHATGAGALTFQARTARYDAVTGLALTSADITPDTSTRRDRQGQANEFTVTRHGGAEQRFVDTVRQDKDGPIDGGSLEVASSTDDDALQNAAWQVGTRKLPRTRLPSLTVDLLTTADVTVLQQVLAADISTLVTVTAMPSQAPFASMSGFVEGWTEQIGAHVWTWSAFTSPNLPSVGKVTAANDPYSATDDTMLVGF